MRAFHPIANNLRIFLVLLNSRYIITVPCLCRTPIEFIIYVVEPCVIVSICCCRRFAFGLMVGGCVEMLHVRMKRNNQIAGVYVSV